MANEESLSPLEYLSKVEEFKKLSEFVQDADFDNCLDNVIKLIARLTNKEVPPPQKVSVLLTLLSAYAFELGVKATYYKAVGKMQPNARTKMDIYKSVAFYLDKLVDSLKYMAK